MNYLVLLISSPVLHPLTTKEKKNPKSWNKSRFVFPTDSRVSEAAENSPGSPKEFSVHRKHKNICA